MSALVASVTLGAAALSAGAVMSVSAATAAGCTSQGTMTINPGLGPILQSESVSFSGTMGCAGEFNGAITTPLTLSGIAGSATSCTGSIEATVCTGFSISGPGFSCTGGIMLWWGYYHEWHCVIGPFAYWHWGVWVPNPVNQGLDITTINFDGADSLAGL